MSRDRKAGLRDLSVALAVLLSMALVLTTGARADQEPRYQVIAALGELNGIALQCRYLEQVRQMKAAVVANAPKERSFGLAFDEATNRSFLAFIEQQAGCPNAETFARRVGHQIDAVQATFAKE